MHENIKLKKKIQKIEIIYINEFKYSSDNAAC